MIKVAVCDEKKEAVDLTAKIQRIFEIDGEKVTLNYFKNASLLRYEIEDRACFDIYILVIQQNQIEKEKKLMETVRERDAEAFFLVLMDETEINVKFPVKFVEIVEKNISVDEMEDVIENIRSAMQKRKKQCYIVKNQSGTWRILYKDIQSITHEGKYSILAVEGEKKVRVRKTLKEVFKELEKHDFIWIDRTRICNLAFVENIHDGMIVMKNGEKLWISRGKIRYFKNVIQEYWDKN